MRFLQTAILIIGLILAIGSPTGADEIATGPGNDTDKGREAPIAIKFYQKYISGIDGDRCGMYPSCSHYSAQAFKEHGRLKGWIMTCDRLLRCSRDEVALAPPIMVKGQWRTYDPLDRNDIWKAKTSCSPHWPIVP